MERLRREGTRCQVIVKSYRRISMTQHRVLFELLLPEGRLGREYVVVGLADEDLANWTVLQVPLAAYARADAATIALDAVPLPARRSILPVIFGAVLVTSLGIVGIFAFLHEDDEGALKPELRALCAAMRGHRIDVANVMVLRRAPTGIAQRALVDFDGEPYEMQLHAAAAAATATATVTVTAPKAPDCLRHGKVELCPGEDSENHFERVVMKPGVRAAFAAYAR
ncbi:Hypothetical protein CAP_2938 [Chondromyces apiculatus DSM 436]|uniref:Uncharacterized protein n=2 Tax=Chondromyces apiculatus TaxID=51 RepID=A0A017T8R9_9BACT|nr:Hypothetical protein CAP_2938 [Chondromyces apiculatus DSM 436]